jgi:hypothetical protein
MKFYTINSDPLCNWSDYAIQNYWVFEKKAHSSSKKASGDCLDDSPGITYRKVQTLRKTAMQMCQWTRPWAQVLPICQPIRFTSKDEICGFTEQRSCAEVYRKPSARTPTSRTNQRNQSGTASTSRAIDHDSTAQYSHCHCQYVAGVHKNGAAS